jgi:CRP-like cAMP-binding protein
LVRSNECTAQILVRLQTCLVLKDEVLAAAGEVLQSMFMLMRGELTVEALEGSPFWKEINSRTSTSEARESKMSKRMPGDGSPSKMGGKKGTSTMKQVLEKPGACVGGCNLLSKSVPPYPIQVTATKKSVLLRIPCHVLKAILERHGKDDVAACTKQLDAEHGRLIGSLLPSAARRSTSTAAAREDDADIGDLLASPEAGVHSAEAAKLKVAEGAQEESRLRERVDELEAMVAQCSAKLGEVRESMSLVPQIVEMLIEKGKIRAI